MRSAIPFLGLLVAGVAVVDGASSCFDDKCDSGTQYINIYSCGLTDDDIPDLAACLDEVGRENIVSLYFDDNELATLPADLFEGLESLVQLSLGTNKLVALAPGLLDGLEKLVALSLGGNELTTLPEGLFDDAGSLSYMDLQGNPDLQCIPTNVATVVKTDEISFDQCECSPSAAVLCDTGLDCMPGDSGYTCELGIAAMAMHMLGGELHYPEVRSKSMD